MSGCWAESVLFSAATPEPCLMLLRDAAGLLRGAAGLLPGFWAGVRGSGATAGLAGRRSKKPRRRPLLAV